MPFVTPDGVTVIVEAALDASVGSYGAWDSAIWNTSTWGPDVVFQDISQWVRSFTTQRKFSRDIQTWEAGTATVVLNNVDGRFSPANLAGPYVTGGITGIRPWRPLRIRAVYLGQAYEIYRGYATAWKDTYVEPYPGGGHVITTVPCVDELAALARFDGLEQASQGAGELSGLRIQRILNNAGHTGRRDIDLGRNTLQATTLAQNAVTELKLTADSEGGALYVNRTGTVVYDQGYALIDNDRSHFVQATFGDQPGDLPLADMSTSYDGDLLVNIAAFARTGGTQQQSVNQTSRALYGDKRYSRTDLLNDNDADVTILADFWVQQYGQPELRVDSITVKPRNNPTALFPQVLDREVRDLIRARRTPPGGYQISQDCHIAGISHTVSEDLNWTTVFDLWSAQVYQGVGRWDEAVWDQSTFFY